MLHWKLKQLCVDRYGSQVKTAYTLGLAESRLSKLIHGYATPSKNERAILEGAFGKSVVRELYGESQRPPA